MFLAYYPLSLKNFAEYLPQAKDITTTFRLTAIDFEIRPRRKAESDDGISSGMGSAI